ncbi:MAG: phosphohydrolase [Clostridiales bacterium]|nr:MAG: phosphohydrolase [Clostridiales bacterium]
MELVERAVVFASNAHNGMKRKGSDIPYIIHPAECVAIVSRLTSDCEIIAAAALHDIIEDTSITEEQLKIEFGEKITRLVCADSEDKMRDKSASETWKLRKQKTIAYLKTNAQYDEKIIILADKLSNIRSIYNEFLQIGDNLWESFNQKDKNEHAWYYSSIADNLCEFSATTAYNEYIELIDKVFGTV